MAVQQDHLVDLASCKLLLNLDIYCTLYNEKGFDLNLYSNPLANIIISPSKIIAN